MNNNKGKIGGSCTDCVGCDDPEEESFCCGCACMDCVYGYSDLDYCDSCDDIPSGTWPWVDYVDTGISKREETEEPVKDFRLSHHHRVSHEHHDHSYLHRRRAGVATLSFKKVTVCDDDNKWFAGGLGRYPAFPRDAQYPWDGIENGKWDSISRYWGNSSESCTSWAVHKNPVADKVWVEPSLLNPLGSMERAQYQSTYEGW